MQALVKQENVNGMRIIVVGGGVIGVSTAWELLRRGHSVELFEARNALALETSHANGGLLSGGMCEPWNAPGVWKDLIASFFNPKSPMKLHLDAVPGMSLWGLRFLAQSTPGRFRANAQASHQLCIASIKHTCEWVRELALDCDFRFRGDDNEQSYGNIKIFNSEKAAEFSRQLVCMLEHFGSRSEFLDRQGVLDKEPALTPIANNIACGIYYPDDAAGDACAFTRALGARFVENGGTIHLGSSVTRFIQQDRCVKGVRVGDKEYSADATVVCAANDTPDLLREFGLKLPVRPVKGYSITVDVSHLPAQTRPGIAVVNQAMHAVVNPLGNNLRIAGTAEFTRKAEPVLSNARIENLIDLLAATYPDVRARINPERVTPWCGFRPMSVDGRPYIGPARIPGLYVNSGHGYLGWTQACGSAVHLANLVDQRPTELPPDMFSVAR